MSNPYTPSIGLISPFSFNPFSPNQQDQAWSDLDPLARILGLSPNTNEVANQSSPQQAQNMQPNSQQQNVLSSFLYIMNRAVDAISLKKPINTEQTDDEKEQQKGVIGAIQKFFRIGLSNTDNQKALREADLSRVADLQRDAEKKREKEEKAAKAAEELTNKQREQQRIEKERREARRRAAQIIKKLTDTKKKKPTHKKTTNKNLARSLNQKILQSIAKMIEEQREKFNATSTEVDIRDMNAARNLPEYADSQNIGKMSKTITNSGKDATSASISFGGPYLVSQKETKTDGPRVISNRGATKRFLENASKAALASTSAPEKTVNRPKTASV